MYEKERRKRRVIGFGLKISLSTLKGETYMLSNKPEQKEER